MISRLTKIISGKEEANWPRKPKKCSNKLMGIIRGEEKVNGSGKPKK